MAEDYDLAELIGKHHVQCDFCVCKFWCTHDFKCTCYNNLLEHMASEHPDKCSRLYSSYELPEFLGVPDYACVALKKMYARLKQHTSPAITDLLHREVLDRYEFGIWPASCSKHHVYEGGLAVHTYEVLRYALQSAILFDHNPTADLTVLTIAAVMHDLAKVWDYELGSPATSDCTDIQTKWVETPYRKLVRHVSGSHAQFIRIFYYKDLLSMKQFENVEHCILSHHGLQEWGSPVEPQTLEARLLHNADMVSALHGHNCKEPPQL